MSETSEDQVTEVETAEPMAPPTAEEMGLDLPEDPAEAQGVLLTKLAEARAEATSYLDDLRRVAADFDNFRRRALKEQSETTQRAAERVVRELLPALDSFDAALAVEPATESETKLLSGMFKTHEQLISILGNQGLVVVPTIGEPFDPEHHEAVMSPPDGEGRLIVSQELRRGYILKDRLVRPALVALEHEG